MPSPRAGQTTPLRGKRVETTVVRRTSCSAENMFSSTQGTASYRLNIVFRFGARVERRESDKVVTTFTGQACQLCAVLRRYATGSTPLLNHLIAREIELPGHVRKRLEARDCALECFVARGRFSRVHGDQSYTSFSSNAR
ncbi:hypothetical protein Y023_3546 [Burkholderia pseudomallei A79D]|nr:hypothetical protein Y023_3546 [Burkholderia pseudomallei A79D]